MDRKTEKFIELINCSLYGYKFLDASYEDVLYAHKMGDKNSISALIFNGFKDWKTNDTIIETCLKDWKNVEIINIINQISKNNELQKVIVSFEEQNILYALFKGVVLSVLYPQDGLRYSGDSDIWVSECDFERADKILKGLGFAKDEEHSKECVYNYRSKYLYIEMHKYLWEDYAGKKIDKIKLLDWTNHNKFNRINVGKVAYNALGCSEHLEFMFFHTIKHYVYSGFGIRHLIDLTVFVNAYNEQIDFNKFWHDMEYVGYGMFCTTALATCEKYLGMDGSILTNKAIPADDFLEKFILAAIDSGTFGDPLVRTAELDGFYDEKSNDNRKLRSIFPTYKEMKRQYEWLKSPILLPAAWICRVFKFALNPELVKAKKDHLKDDELRQALMQELELK